MPNQNEPRLCNAEINASDEGKTKGKSRTN